MIKYVCGDATRPDGDGPKVIAHVCNDVGAWGAGFVLAVSRRWPQPEEFYREWSRTRVLREHALQNPTKGRLLITTGDFGLSQVQLVQVGPLLYVANMVAQTGVGTRGSPPIRYGALETCLRKLAVVARELPVGAHDKAVSSFHLPRIGCGLAGGNWETVGPIVEAELGRFDVTVYDP